MLLSTFRASDVFRAFFLGMTFSANIADLGFFLPTGSGLLQANGLVSLVPGKPRLRLDLAGERVGWDDLSIANLSIQNSN